MQRYVVGFMFDHGCSEVALIRKNRPKWQQGKLNGIGGHVEKGELDEVAMKREFYEETGVIHKEWKHIATLQVFNGPTLDANVSVFTTYGDLTKLQTTTDEKIEIINLGDLYYRSLINNLQYLIPLCLYNDNLICPVTIKQNHE